MAIGTGIGVDVSCLYSIIRCIAGATTNFTFLPAHGRKLADGEEFATFGDIYEAIIREGGRNASKRQIDGFVKAIEDRVIEVVQTPALIMRDEDDQDIKMVTLKNGVLGLDVPCWHGSLTGSESVQAEG